MEQELLFTHFGIPDIMHSGIWEVLDKCFVELNCRNKRVSSEWSEKMICKKLTGSGQSVLLVENAWWFIFSLFLKTWSSPCEQGRFPVVASQRQDLTAKPSLL